MLLINGVKGIFTLNEVIEMLGADDILFKLVLDGDSKWNYRVENFVNKDVNSDSKIEMLESENGARID